MEFQMCWHHNIYRLVREWLRSNLDRIVFVFTLLSSAQLTCHFIPPPSVPPPPCSMAALAAALASILLLAPSGSFKPLKRWKISCQIICRLVEKRSVATLQRFHCAVFLQPLLAVFSFRSNLDGSFKMGLHTGWVSVRGQCFEKKTRFNSCNPIKDVL